MPVFNQHLRLADVVAQLRAQGLPVWLIDDGSSAATRSAIDALAREPGIDCIHLPRNRGKGAAVMTGLRKAAQEGCTHALQVDADGQHDLADVPALLACARNEPDALVSGAPVYDDSVPRVRFYGRYLTHALIWFDTLSRDLRDSMCGFRVYPLAPTLALMDRVRIGQRMDFDTDIMTRLYWAGTASRFVPTHVRYPEGGVSHFRMVRDNARMVWLHVRLLLGMAAHVPALLRRRRERRVESHWARIAERGSIGGLRFIDWVDRRLGRRVCRLILTPVVIYFMLVQVPARRAARSFFRAVGIRAGAANRFRQIMNFALSIVDKVKLWRDPTSVAVDCSACGAMVAGLQRGQGALLIAAHIGNMEAARAFAQQLPGVRITALVHTANSRMVNAMLRRSNPRYPLRLIEVDALGPDTAVLLKARVAAGELVVIAGDRVPVGAGGRTVTVPFLGRPARLPVGPYVLAHALSCPVYLLFCMRQADGYRATAEAFAERIRLPRTQRLQAAAGWASKYAERLGEYARANPLQWYNFYDIWAPDPAQAVERGVNHAVSAT